MTRRAELLERIAVAFVELVDERAAAIADERIAVFEEHRAIDSDRPLDRSGAAAFLDTSLASFDRLRKKAGFPRPLMLGDSPRWLRRELLQWLESQREGERQLRVVRGDR